MVTLPEAYDIEAVKKLQRIDSLSDYLS